MVTLQEILDVCKQVKWEIDSGQLRVKIGEVSVCPLTYYIYAKTGNLCDASRVNFALNLLKEEDMPEWNVKNTIINASDDPIDLREKALVAKELLGW